MQKQQTQAAEIARTQAHRLRGLEARHQQPDLATQTSTPSAQNHDGASNVTNASADAAPSAADGAVRGKVAVVTGASSGLGLETAKQLASQGAEIIMVVRNQTRGQQARTQIARAATGKPPVLLLADLSVQAEIRRVADEIKARYGRIDILVRRDEAGDIRSFGAPVVSDQHGALVAFERNV